MSNQPPETTEMNAGSAQSTALASTAPISTSSTPSAATGGPITPRQRPGGIDLPTNLSPCPSTKGSSPHSHTLPQKASISSANTNLNTSPVPAPMSRPQPSLSTNTMSQAPLSNTNNANSVDARTHENTLSTSPRQISPTPSPMTAEPRYTVASSNAPKPPPVPIIDPSLSGDNSAADATSINDTSITTTNTNNDMNQAEAVLLGVQALERQQAELERRRDKALQSHSAQQEQRTVHIRKQNPFDTEGGMTFSDNQFQPQDYHPSGTGVPNMVHLVDGSMMSVSNNSEETKMADDLHSSSLAKKIGRSSSFSRFLTPLKNTGQKIRSTFNNNSDHGIHQENQLGTNTSNPNPVEDKDDPSSSPQDNDVTDSTSYLKPIIYGYLHKLGRNGAWQRRWFETDGKSLLYFKTKKRMKLLATLDLLKVGQIMLDYTDPQGCTFTIKVAKRNYYLCAESKERAKDWVINLNRVKEARMNIGGLKLLEPNWKDEDDERNRTESDEYTARVVMVTARERTRAYGRNDIDDLRELMEGEKTPNPLSQSQSQVETPQGGIGMDSPGSHTISNLTSHHSTPRPTNISPQPPANLPVLSPVPEKLIVRWEKRRSSIQNWTRRMSRWARRMTMLRCVVKDDVVHLDQHRHVGDLHIPMQTNSNHGDYYREHDQGFNGRYEPVEDMNIHPVSGLIPSEHSSARPQYSNLSLENQVSARTLNHISEGDTCQSSTSKSQTNDDFEIQIRPSRSFDCLTGYEQAAKAASVRASWAGYDMSSSERVKHPRVGSARIKAMSDLDENMSEPKRDDGGSASVQSDDLENDSGVIA